MWIQLSSFLIARFPWREVGIQWEYYKWDHFVDATRTYFLLHNACNAGMTEHASFCWHTTSIHFKLYELRDLTTLPFHRYRVLLRKLESSTHTFGILQRYSLNEPFMSMPTGGHIKPLCIWEIDTWWINLVYLKSSLLPRFSTDHDDRVYIWIRIFLYAQILSE